MRSEYAGHFGAHHHGWASSWSSVSVGRGICHLLSSLCASNFPDLRLHSSVISPRITTRIVRRPAQGSRRGNVLRSVAQVRLGPAQTATEGLYAIACAVVPLWIPHGGGAGGEIIYANDRYVSDRGLFLLITACGNRQVPAGRIVKFPRSIPTLARSITFGLCAVDQSLGICARPTSWFMDDGYWAKAHHGLVVNCKESFLRTGNNGV